MLKYQPLILTPTDCVIKVQWQHALNLHYIMSFMETSD